VRTEIRWTIAAAVGLALGALGADSYARLVAPYDAAVSRLIAGFHPWTIVDVEADHETDGPAGVLRLTGEVRRQSSDPTPAVRVVTSLQVGATAQTPVVFWTLLVMWPASSIRRRLAHLALGVPVFLGLEAATTVCQLLNPLAEASAILGGDADPLTSWERCSRFMESGGRIVLAIGGVAVTLTLCRWMTEIGPRTRA
jgi:hypothetical protein